MANDRKCNPNQLKEEEKKENLTTSSVNDFRKRMLIEEKEESKPVPTINHSHSIDRQNAELIHQTHLQQNGVTTN